MPSLQEPGSLGFLAPSPAACPGAGQTSHLAVRPAGADSRFLLPILYGAKQIHSLRKDLISSAWYFSERKKKKKKRGKQVYLSLNNRCEYRATHKYFCHMSNGLFGCWDSQEILKTPLAPQKIATYILLLCGNLYLIQHITGRRKSGAVLRDQLCISPPACYLG